VPCNVAGMHQEGNVVTVVANVSEENPAAQQGDLKSLDVDVGMVGPPRVCPDTVGDDGCKQAVKVA
jgi:hypothetical protein